MMILLIYYLDAYGEGKQAYELVVNPYGIQGDLVWTVDNGGSEDASLDIIWYSEAKIYNGQMDC